MIIRPIVSEKSYALLSANKYTFRVHDGAHKTQIRQAVEEIFGVRVLEVRTMSVKSKPKRRGYTSGRSARVEEGRRAAAPRGPHRALRGPGDRRVPMAVKRHKPTRPAAASPPGRDRAEVTKKSPEKALTEGLKKSGGRNTHGRITSRHRGGGAKRLYRMIDFKRQQGRRARSRRRDRVRPEPDRLHRADPLRRRRQALHPRAEPAARRA